MDPFKIQHELSALMKAMTTLTTEIETERQKCERKPTLTEKDKKTISYFKQQIEFQEGKIPEKVKELEQKIEEKEQRLQELEAEFLLKKKAYTSKIESMKSEMKDYKNGNFAALKQFKQQLQDKEEIVGLRIKESDRLLQLKNRMEAMEKQKADLFRIFNESVSQELGQRTRAYDTSIWDRLGGGNVSLLDDLEERGKTKMDYSLKQLPHVEEKPLNEIVSIPVKEKSVSVNGENFQEVSSQNNFPENYSIPPQNNISLPPPSLKKSEVKQNQIANREFSDLHFTLSEKQEEMSQEYKEELLLKLEKECYNRILNGESVRVDRKNLMIVPFVKKEVISTPVKKEKEKEKEEVFECKPCGYVAKHKHHLEKHCETKKHKRTVNPPVVSKADAENDIEGDTIQCSECHWRYGKHDPRCSAHPEMFDETDSFSSEEDEEEDDDKTQVIDSLEQFEETSEESSDDISEDEHEVEVQEEAQKQNNEVRHVHFKCTLCSHDDFHFEECPQHPKNLFFKNVVKAPTPEVKSFKTNGPSRSLVKITAPPLPPKRVEPKLNVDLRSDFRSNLSHMMGTHLY